MLRRIGIRRSPKRSSWWPSFGCGQQSSDGDASSLSSFVNCVNTTRARKSSNQPGTSSRGFNRTTSGNCDVTATIKAHVDVLRSPQTWQLAPPSAVVDGLRLLSSHGISFPGINKTVLPTLEVTLPMLSNPELAATIVAMRRLGIPLTTSTFEVVHERLVSHGGLKAFEANDLVALWWGCRGALEGTAVLDQFVSLEKQLAAHLSNSVGELRLSGALRYAELSWCVDHTKSDQKGAPDLPKTLQHLRGHLERLRRASLGQLPTTAEGHRRLVRSLLWLLRGPCMQNAVPEANHVAAEAIAVLSNMVACLTPHECLLTLRMLVARQAWYPTEQHVFLRQSITRHFVVSLESTVDAVIDVSAIPWLELANGVPSSWASAVPLVANDPEALQMVLATLFATLDDLTARSLLQLSSYLGKARVREALVRVVDSGVLGEGGSTVNVAVVQFMAKLYVELGDDLMASLGIDPTVEKRPSDQRVVEAVELLFGAMQGLQQLRELGPSDWQPPVAVREIMVESTVRALEVLGPLERAPAGLKKRRVDVVCGLAMMGRRGDLPPTAVNQLRLWAGNAAYPESGPLTQVFKLGPIGPEKASQTEPKQPPRYPDASSFTKPLSGTREALSWNAAEKRGMGEKLAPQPV